jgi:hypothetical protein
LFEACPLAIAIRQAGILGRLKQPNKPLEAAEQAKQSACPLPYTLTFFGEVMSRSVATKCDSKLSRRLAWVDQVRRSPMGELAGQFKLCLEELTELSEKIANEVPAAEETPWGKEYLAPNFRKETEEWLADVAAIGRLAQSMGGWLSSYNRM